MQKNVFDERVIAEIKEKSALFQTLTTEISKAVVGRDSIVSFVEIAILCEGHILLEGVPGIAKTTLIKAIARAIGLHFSRIQFTPDLLPADLIGTLVYNPKTQEFYTKKGPVFANLILADEINRAPAKVQAALLEAMQEQQVTIGSETFNLDKPFLVFATQNPIEQEGTYRLPEAQVDRFMFKLLMHYQNKEHERELLHKKIDLNAVRTVLKKEDIFEAQELIKSIYVDDKIKDYIVDIVFATRDPRAYNLKDLIPLIQTGVSPRATLALHKASMAHAFLKGRHFVIPDDVKHVAPAILRHRITLSYDAQAEEIPADTIINKLLAMVPSP